MVLRAQGFPDSVTPQYAPYMMWRGVQYFFGGAIGVYTTKALIQSVGVSASRAAASSAALQWVVKDGAGRAGRFLFARWGKVRAVACPVAPSFQRALQPSSNLAPSRPGPFHAGLGR